MARAMELFCEISGDTTNEYYEHTHLAHYALAPSMQDQVREICAIGFWAAALFFMSPQIYENVADKW